MNPVHALHHGQGLMKEMTGHMISQVTWNFVSLIVNPLQADVADLQ